MDNDGYIELKDIRKDRIKTKSVKLLYEFWQATKEFFIWIGLEFKKLFGNKSKPPHLKKPGKNIMGNFVAAMQKMARNLESWEKSEKRR